MEAQADRGVGGVALCSVVRPFQRFLVLALRFGLGSRLGGMSDIGIGAAFRRLPRTASNSDLGTFGIWATYTFLYERL